AAALARGAPPDRRVVVDLVLAQDRSYRGRPDPALTRSVADRFLAAADPDLAWPVAEALVHSDEWRTARSVVDAMLPLARARSQVPALTWIQVVNAEVALHDGDLDAATDASVEALTMARAVGLDLAAVQAEAGLAQVDAAAGRATACAARVARVEEGCRAHGFAAPLLYTDLATARLALSQGDGPRAVGLFEAAVRRWDAWGSVGLVVWTALPELVEAQVRARDLDAARATLARLEATPGAGATATGRAWLAHCRLAAARDRDLDGAYEAALGRLEETSHPMLAARTRLVRAERVRRAGRPGDARLAAQEALDRFDALGALLWRERAARELAALGRQAPPPVSSLLHRLTPQERQIAQIAATGASTREIAVALFLSPKTVEHHLTRIYRELGLRSKTELAARLAVGPVSLPRPSP
ncbi:MAG: helix-turn-helix transcriptional regulator, partial [Nocardioidaceae bacterium]